MKGPKRGTCPGRSSRACYQVLLQGADEPQAKPLQWILGKLLSDIALSPVSGQRETFTEWDPFSSTSVLYVDTTSGGSISGENGTIFSLC